ncbi:MAG TPA: diaminopimelate decarboxylase [Polyangiaceae bacterium]|jgi:diaminopimelate decarboxylase
MVARVLGFRRDAQGHACFGSARLSELVAAAQIETPAYLYDLDAIRAEAERLSAGFGSARHVIAYAVKANSAGSIVRALAEAGTGADVVSKAELQVALGAGVPAGKIVMSGVAKKDDEIDFAIAAEIHAIQAESVEELARIAARARALGRRARIAFRLNPGVEIDSHAHVATGHDRAKFGIAKIDVSRALAAVDDAPNELSLVGLSAHIGSMLTALDPYRASALHVCELARARHAHKPLEYISFGGGFGIDYGDKPAPTPADFAAHGVRLLAEQRLDALTLVVEPGRSLVGAHGVLVATVVQAKQSGAQRWVMIDAGMNDLLRPALYAAKHRIEPLERAPGGPEWRVVGPVCESSDDFGAHTLGETAPHAVVIRDAGAYGFTMASEYNGRALPSEVFVRDERVVSVSASPGSAAWVKRRLEA